MLTSFMIGSQYGICEGVSANLKHHQIVDAFTGKGWSAPLWLVQAKERDVLEEMTKSGPYAPGQLQISGLRAGEGKSKKAKEPKKEAAPNLEPIDGPPLDIYEDVDFSPGH
jgi:hypothetical protein